jgi:hypothetical protein
LRRIPGTFDEPATADDDRAATFLDPALFAQAAQKG